MSIIFISTPWMELRWISQKQEISPFQIDWVNTDEDGYGSLCEQSKERRAREMWREKTTEHDNTVGLMEPRYTIHIYILLLCSALLFCRSVEEKGQLLMIFIFTLLCVLCKSMLNKCPSCKCLPLSIKTPSNLKQIKYSHNRKTYVGIHLSNLLIPHIFLWITHHLK